MHPSVHCSTVYNNQAMEATQISVNRQKSLQMVTAAMKLKDTYPLERKLDQLSILKSRDITF